MYFRYVEMEHLIETHINFQKESYPMKSIDKGARPFLKWAGGKRQLLKQFEGLYPKELKEKKIENYYEPFVGGGSVFFEIAQRFAISNAYLYDINDELILAYRVIQKDVHKLLEYLAQHQKQYKKLTESKQKDYYYEVREKFNQARFNVNYSCYSENWIPRAAQIIFLNKTCFNGLFRFNSKGAFNTPQGKYKNPKILDEANLEKVSYLLQVATIKRADFREIKNDLTGKPSFIYFDPPYKPISKTASFTAYSKYTFQDKEQLELAKLFHELDKDGHKLMLSNSDPKNTDPTDQFFEQAYQGFSMTRVDARRAINTNPKKRTAIKEIVVTNY